MNVPRQPGRGTMVPGGRDMRGGQRFGHVAGPPPATGDRGTPRGTYRVLDDETGITYSFSYADIVTEGLRAIRAGERVRFLIDYAHPGHARYVVRLDLPDITELYT